MCFGVGIANNRLVNFEKGRFRQRPPGALRLAFAADRLGSGRAGRGGARAFSLLLLPDEEGLGRGFTSLRGGNVQEKKVEVSLG